MLSKGKIEGLVKNYIRKDKNMKKPSEYPNVYIRTFEHKIILTITAFMLIFFSTLSFSYAAASRQSIPDAIKKFAENKKRMRIAVLDFANTSGEKTRFDGYIADSIVSDSSFAPLKWRKAS